MQLDLLAGTRDLVVLPPRARRRRTVLVFDSGIGGLSVFDEIARLCHGADIVYAADDAAFPYGNLGGEVLVRRILDVMDTLIATHAPDLVVVACNTASTVVLPHLRARFPIPFIGTVPAIKPAAEQSRSGLVSVLATPGTVRRDYTRELIGAYAGTCRIRLVGATDLAAYAEAELAGRPVPEELIRNEIAPCFVEDGGTRTDAVVLACTHYPLIRHRLEAAAPWPVTWIDPAPAVARRAAAMLDAPPGRCRRRLKASFTGGDHLTSELKAALATRGLGEITIRPIAAGTSWNSYAA